jgi:hypothetical protein
MVAYCYRSGEIEIGTDVPTSGILLARGEEKVLKEAISARARLAYDNKTFLVPGIPEATDEETALLAARTFSQLLLEGEAAP